jgi:hypothetical protein
MKSDTKASITLPPEELKLVIALQARLKAKSKGGRSARTPAAP